MKNKLTAAKYAALSLIGTILLTAAFSHSPVLPESQACGNTPNCPDGWTFTGKSCEGPCNCGGNQISLTCYNETGICNADGNPIVFTACYRGNCCCPSGNCAGQGGGGRGGGDLVGFNNVGESCTSDWDCDVAYFCDQTTGTCQ